MHSPRLRRPARAAPRSRPSRSATSIDRAVAYLKRQQNANGTWPDHPAYPAASRRCARWRCSTPASTVDDEQHAKGARRTCAALKPTQTYVVALQTMVFCAAEPKKDLLLIRRNAKWLEDTQITQRRAQRRLVAIRRRPAAAAIPRTRQFALLALHEAERAGVKVSDKTWRLALTVLAANCRTPTAPGATSQAAPGTGSMTCAGIASLIIASGELNGGDAKVVDGAGAVLRRPAGRTKPSRTGCAGWSATSRCTRNPSGGGGTAARWLLYYLYGVERVGRMTARRFIGKHDWYREGAEMLVRNQDQLSGFWKGTGNAENNPHDRHQLRPAVSGQGRRPVLVAKLKHGPGDDWNHHRSDLANLTSYVEKQWKRDSDLAGHRSGGGHGRRPAAIARAVHQRPATRRSSPPRRRSACATTSTAAASSLPKPAAAAPSSTRASAS